MNQLLDTFIDSTKVTKSHIPVVNIPLKIEIPTGKLQSSMTNEPKPRLKRGRPIVSKDTIPRKRKSVISMTPEEHITVKPQVDEQVALAEAPIKELSSNDVPVHNNEKISINYIHKGRIWDRNTTHINDAFFFQVAMDIIRNDEDQEPQNVNECRQRNDWLQWKEAMKTELRSLAKREVFGPVVQTPTNIQPVGY